jgi:hypothetical protein
MKVPNWWCQLTQSHHAHGVCAGVPYSREWPDGSTVKYARTGAIYTVEGFRGDIGDYYCTSAAAGGLYTTPEMLTLVSLPPAVA